ncbi:A24 family peptidase [Burkholderia cepacia]|uniref:Peptidase A24A, prepilin type IV n=1 Tax=Burkholderia cepacia GG4 TaxID=1009846 RepID=A0A9W3K123_BURCE|nr:prepilin peptidase [Burkholderia cepacia]AFQ48334.1 peptidase A24A, prepilin type IV [Burkholderia cepacia GG4]
MAYLFSIGAFLAWAVLVAASDIRSRRIPNLLVAGGLVAALASAFYGVNPFGVVRVQALLGMLVGLLGLLPFFFLRVMGAADVKVFAVLGAWCGVHGLLWLWIAASLAAGIHALAVLLLSRTPLGALWRRDAPTLTLGRYRATPYGACLAIPAAVWLVCLVAGGGVR